MLPSILAAVLSFTAPDAPMSLRADGDRIIITCNTRVVASAPAATTERVVIRGVADRDDTLTIDLSQSLHLPGGIDYDGGARGFDVLELRGGSLRNQITTQLTPHDGIIELDGLVVRYTNLEPITDTAPAANYTVNGTAGFDDVTISDGPGGTTTISSPSFESVAFANKTNVVYDGLGGGDTVRFWNPTPATGLVSFIVTNVEAVSGAEINYPSFGVSATGNISLYFDNDVDNVELFSQNGGIFFDDVDSVTVGGVSSTLTGISGAGIVTLRIENDLIVDAGSVVTGGQIWITALNVLIDGSLVNSVPNPINVSAAGVVVTGGILGPAFISTVRIVIDPAATVGLPNAFVTISSTNIDLGSTGDASPTALELSQAEISRIVAYSLELLTNGTITVSQPIVFPGHLVVESEQPPTATGSGNLNAPTLSIVGPPGDRTWTITPATIQISGGAPIPYSGVSTLSTYGDWFTETNDTLVVTPSPTTTIHVNGNLPTPPASPGDTLDFELAGVVSPVLTVTLGPNGYSGRLTSANRQRVTFSDIETLVDAPVDIAVTKTDNATTAVAGTNVDYVITVTNNSPLIVAGVNVTDLFSSQFTSVSWICNGAGATCSGSGMGNINDTVTFLPNGTANYLVTATLSPSATGTLSNTANVTTPAGFTEANPTNNTATDTSTIVAVGDLITTKSAASGTVLPGGDITYTITLRNAGPSDAQNVVLTDVLPAGTSFVSLAAPPAYACTTGATITCSIATLAPSATADTFTLVVRVSPTAPPGTVVTNTATVASTTTDPATPAATAAVTITAVPAGIPTLSEWMLMLFAGLLGLVALRAARVFD